MATKASAADGGAAERVAPGARASVALELVLQNARLWSLDAPALYDARVRLLHAGQEIDAVADRFGVRSVESRQPLLRDAVNLYFGMWDGEIARDLTEIDDRVHEPTRDALARLARFFGEKPIVLTEFGTIGIPGSGGDARFSEDYQAAYVSAVWRAVEEVPEIAGGIVWSWADYRHRRGFTNDFPAFFGPFGIVTIDRRPKKAHAALTELWTAGKGMDPK